MHQSWFEYPVTRPYPFRWFTPVVIGGAVVLAVVFSLVNLSSNGYYLKTVYTGNLNETEQKYNSRWYQKRPFNWESDMDAKCQPYMLAIGSSFYTSNLGFQYTVKKIEVPGNDTRTLPAIGYRNTTLENCRLSEIRLLLARTPGSEGPSWWYAYRKSTVATTLRCSVPFDSGVAEITLTAEAIGSSSTYDYIIDDDYKTRASVWWGTRLSQAYFVGVLAAAAEAPFENDNCIIDADLKYGENDRVDDLYSDDFLKLRWSFGLENAGVFHMDSDGADEVVVYNDPFWGSPSITEGLHYAKIMHSLFALDLGNCGLPNLLLDDKGLEYAATAPDDSFRREGALLNNPDTYEQKNADRYSKISSLDDDDNLNTTLRDAYREFPPLMGELSCSNATIAAQYLCSVPQQKSTGVMIMAIVVADLVFLQAAWKVMQLVSGRMLNQPDAMVCQGCRATQVNETELEHNPSRSTPRVATDQDQESLLQSMQEQESDPRRMPK